MKFPLSKESILKVVILFGFSFIVIFTNLSFFSNRLNDTFIDIKNFFVQNTVAFADTSGHTVSDAGFIRFGIWDGSLRLFFSSPKNVVIGTGPETFAYVFQKFRPTVLNYSSEWDFILNKPHNYYIEVLTELGLFGLFVYLILLYQLLKFSPPYLFGGIVAFIVTNFFGWPCVFLNLLFWIFLTYEKYETE